MVNIKLKRIFSLKIQIGFVILKNKRFFHFTNLLVSSIRYNSPLQHTLASTFVSWILETPPKRFFDLRFYRLKRIWLLPFHQGFVAFLVILPYDPYMPGIQL